MYIIREETEADRQANLFRLGRCLLGQGWSLLYSYPPCHQRHRCRHRGLYHRNLRDHHRLCHTKTRTSSRSKSSSLYQVVTPRKTVGNSRTLDL